VTDRETKLRSILHLNGSGILSYWLGMFICDLLLFLLPTFMFLILVKAIKIDSFGNEIGGLFLLLFGFGLSLIPLTYLIQFLFQNVTQAIKCVIPGYLLFGTALPFVFAVLIASLSEKFGDSEFYFRFFLGLLYLTTPMFTFFITFFSLILEYYGKLLTTEPTETFRVELFAQGMMTAEPKIGFACFAG
jgi:ABC-2 family transporter protein